MHLGEETERELMIFSRSRSLKWCDHRTWPHSYQSFILSDLGTFNGEQVIRSVYYCYS